MKIRPKFPKRRNGVDRGPDEEVVSQRDGWDPCGLGAGSSGGYSEVGFEFCRLENRTLVVADSPRSLNMRMIPLSCLQDVDTARHQESFVIRISNRDNEHCWPLLVTHESADGNPKTEPENQ